MQLASDCYYPKWNGLLQVTSVEFERVNKRNMSSRGPIGRSKYKGVCQTRNNAWRTIIYKNGSQIYVGVYDNEYDAAKAYDLRSTEYFGKNAYLNFPSTDIDINLRNIKK